MEKNSKLRHELSAWKVGKNNESKRIRWQFRTEDARFKLVSLYPKLVRRLYIISMFTCAFLLSSCCTLFCRRGTADCDISIESNVPGANVFINNQYVGVTPYQHSSNKVDVKKIRVEAPGYIPQTQKTKKKVKGCIYWNFFPAYTFIYGYFVDRANKTGLKYTEHYYFFNLEKSH